MAETTETWAAHETRSVVWRLIKGAGEHGIGRKALVAAAGKSDTSIDWHLSNLFRDKHIARVQGLGPARWKAGPTLPPIAGLLLEMVLPMVEDCPAGVSGELLCAATGAGSLQLLQALEPAEQDGRLERIRMPARYGGGVGWCLPGMSAAAEPPPPRLEPAAMSREHQAVCALQVVEVDIDRIHRVQRHELFECALQPGGRLTLTAGALTMTLSRAQTDKLMQFVLQQACSGVGE